MFSLTQNVIVNTIESDSRIKSCGRGRDPLFSEAKQRQKTTYTLETTDKQLLLPLIHPGNEEMGTTESIAINFHSKNVSISFIDKGTDSSEQAYIHCIASVKDFKLT